MTLRARLALGMSVGIVLAGVTGAADALSSNLERLRQLPLERRQALHKDLLRFDALPADQREAIRALDRQIAELPEQDQARYRQVLRRYHVWLGSLTAEQREAIQAAPPAGRMERVRQYLAEAPPPSWTRLDELLLLGSTLNATPLFEQVYAISAWFTLDEPSRASLQKLPTNRRLERLLELAREAGVPDPRPAGVRKAEENVREKIAARVKRFDQMKAQQKAATVRRMAEAIFLDRYDPPPVEPARLGRFAAALPGWLLEPLDGLPPGVARKRLEVLYRLTFGEEGEMPEPAPEKAKAPAPEKKAPAAPSSSSDPSPF
jgi:hypothetical protein